VLTHLPANTRQDERHHRTPSHTGRNWRGYPVGDRESISGLPQAFRRASAAKAVIDKVRNGSDFHSIKVFSHFLDDSLGVLRTFLSRYGAAKNPVFGYLFKGAKLAQIDADFQRVFTLSVSDPPHKILGLLASAAGTLTQINAQIDVVAPGQGILTVVHASLTNEEFGSAIESLAALASDYEYHRTHVVPSIPKSVGKLKIDFSRLDSLCENALVSMPEEEFNRLLRYAELHWKVNNAFASIPSVSYSSGLREIEQLATVEMTYQLDGRVIEFYEHNKATARTLRDVIRTKQRFPKEEFGKLRKAFPCILAGIRDYAEYIPLEAEAFDLLIIDEASQVSVAQAFPALLRAKKVLILGDKRQFSNIKAAQARSETNREYLNNLEISFKANVSRDITKLVKLRKFNIRTSILEFFEFITNYQTQLVKHFRGYKEIISYSNKFFYENSLQVMKIRGKPIEEVLKFSTVTPVATPGQTENTNKAEVDYIIAQLQKLKGEKIKLSVGIITPHTNQQKLLMESISRLPDRDYYFDDLKLKIMTFDTCQGEERDLILYSMVATVEDDRLWGVFIKDLEHVDLEEQGQIKAQRLNVGFSRAKECIHFVVSKSLEEFRGSIGEALRHYWNALQEAKKEHTAAEVDTHSAMEPLVLTWFYQTPFWQENKDHSELIPQFEIGKYLKQLDKTYSHPLYRVDFLFVYRADPGQDKKIIIEYDGFREHFEDLPFVGSTNYREYYSEDDVYRQKVLESYGYRFVRINKFNVGTNPIATLDQRMREALSSERKQSQTVANIHTAIEGLQNGDMKECPKCKNLRKIEEFKDSALASGFGRFCAECKTRKVPRRTRAKAVTQSSPVSQQGQNPCPKCNAKMILRRGRFGPFYGCSKYPYCKGTRQLSGTVGFRK
jgi:very-short-patch-repair endonuclease